MKSLPDTKRDGILDLSTFEYPDYFNFETLKGGCSLQQNMGFLKHFYILGAG